MVERSHNLSERTFAQHTDHFEPVIEMALWLDNQVAFFIVYHCILSWFVVIVNLILMIWKLRKLRLSQYLLHLEFWHRARKPIFFRFIKIARVTFLMQWDVVRRWPEFWFRWTHHFLAAFCLFRTDKQRRIQLLGWQLFQTVTRIRRCDCEFCIWFGRQHITWQVDFALVGLFLANWEVGVSRWRCDSTFARRSEWSLVYRQSGLLVVCLGTADEFFAWRLLIHFQFRGNCLLS